jgi:glycerol-3-phosphate dehydrogenase (NAD(P)+)
VVAAAEEESLAREVQTVLHGPTFRVYRADDLAGVEWGGSLKNVYAMAAGMCAGLGLGENSLAGLLTRSLREMVRVAVELGAKEETLYGLSGVGDLMLTSYSRASRNRRVGERIGAGDKLEKALNSVEGVCEGVPTTQALHGLMAKRRVEAPVADQLFAVLFEGKSPKAALQALMERDPKAETD